MEEFDEPLHRMRVRSCYLYLYVLRVACTGEPQGPLELCMPIRPQETSIVGSWYVSGGRTVADEKTRRIEELRRSELVELAKSADGWDTLLRDPADGRLWELTYPSSEMHGGGPPSLNALSREAAASKYGRSLTPHQQVTDDLF
jgi:hypothetical protein